MNALLQQIAAESDLTTLLDAWYALGGKIATLIESEHAVAAAATEITGAVLALAS